VTHHELLQGVLVTCKERAFLQTGHYVPPTNRAVYTIWIHPEQSADIHYEGMESLCRETSL